MASIEDEDKIAIFLQLHTVDVVHNSREFATFSVDGSKTVSFYRAVRLVVHIVLKRLLLG